MKHMFHLCFQWVVRVGLKSRISTKFFSPLFRTSCRTLLSVQVLGFHDRHISRFITNAIRTTQACVACNIHFSAKFLLNFALLLVCHSFRPTVYQSDYLIIVPSYVTYASKITTVIIATTFVRLCIFFVGLNQSIVAFIACMSCICFSTFTH